MTYLAKIDRATAAPVDPARIAEARAMADDLRAINAIDRHLITATPRPVEATGSIRSTVFVLVAFAIGIAVGAYAVHADPVGRLAADLARIEALK